MLFIISTPIGNLADITYRAVATLQECDYILCEDTRHSGPLLTKYSINKPLYSYHQHNEASRTDQVLKDLLDGKRVALISDAGTPGISDPGHQIIVACHQADIPVVPIPGPSAVIAALSASPLPTDRFQFIGFLPKSQGALKQALQDALAYPGTTACYESPFRLSKTLKALCALTESAPVAVCRELTKVYEEIRWGSAKEVREHYEQHPPKGEIVLLIGHFELKLEHAEEDMSHQEALRILAKRLNMSRNELYALINKKSSC